MGSSLVRTLVASGCPVQAAAKAFALDERTVSSWLLRSGQDGQQVQVDEAKPQQWHRQCGFEECGIIAGINPHGVGEVFFRKRLG